MAKPPWTDEVGIQFNVGSIIESVLRPGQRYLVVGVAPANMFHWPVTCDTNYGVKNPICFRVVANPATFSPRQYGHFRNSDYYGDLGETVERMTAIDELFTLNESGRPVR